MLPDEKIKLLKYLYDALNATEIVQKETVGINVKQYQMFNIRWVIERGIEIISEALKRAAHIEPNLPLTDINKIFATRNKIAHEYDLVDPFMLYNIVQKNIPLLTKELRVYIQTLETS